MLKPLWHEKLTWRECGVLLILNNRIDSVVLYCYTETGSAVGASGGSRRTRSTSSSSATSGSSTPTLGPQFRSNLQYQPEQVQLIPL